MSENLLQLYKSGYALDANGNEVANSDFNIYQALVNVNVLQYTLSGTAPSDRYIRVHEYINNTWVRQIIVDYGSNLPFSITKSANTNRFLVSINKNNSNMALTAYYIWHATEGEYPINDNALSIVQTTFTPLFPTWLWRIDSSNDGYPYTELLLGILYFEPEPPPDPYTPESYDWLEHWFIRKNDMNLARSSVMGYISGKANKSFKPANFKHLSHWNNSIQELNNQYYEMIGEVENGGRISLERDDN